MKVYIKQNLKQGGQKKGDRCSLKGKKIIHFSPLWEIGGVKLLIWWWVKKHLCLPVVSGPMTPDSMVEKKPEKTVFSVYFTCL